MKRRWILGVLVSFVGLAALVAVVVLSKRSASSVVPSATDATPATAPAAESDHPAFLHGRVTALDGATFEGRIRFGGDEEAFWTDGFNGFEDVNRWAPLVPPERLPREDRTLRILGFEIRRGERPVDLGRPFLARFGDIARIEAIGTDVRVTLKSGTSFDLDRFEASDFDDGVRVWDRERGVVDLDSSRIRAIELYAAPGPGVVPARLHGRVRTRSGELTGFLQWNRQAGLGSDELRGETGDGEVELRLETVRAIEREPDGGARVTLVDEKEIVLAGAGESGPGSRGVYVDDPRYGRVLVSWRALERVDFTPPGAAGGGPVYDDFPPGRPLAGSVATRDGRRLAGRLVFDLDESETTQTLDAPCAGIDYLIPFERIVSITPPARAGRDDRRAAVALAGGESLALEAEGDLGDRNAGLLVFVDGGERPEYVPWGDVARIDFEREPVTATSPGADGGVGRVDGVGVPAGSPPDGSSREEEPVTGPDLPR
jgi:hypothetical protein